MARRSRKKQKNTQLPTIIGAVAALALVAGGFFYLKSSKSGADRDFSPVEFPMETYVNNGNSLRGANNYYSLTGEVFEKRSPTTTTGLKLFVEVEIDPATYPANFPKSLGIFVPAEINGPNIETKQSYHFIVQAARDGSLTAVEYESK